MNAKCQDRSWQKGFLEMKAHKSEVIKYLLGWPCGVGINGGKLGSMQNMNT